jgi:hypothetical protein
MMIMDKDLKKSYRGNFTEISDYRKYEKMVCSPFNNEAVRGPSKFF